MKTIIHVNQHTIRSNTKNGSDDPPLLIRTYKGVKHAHEVKVRGEVSFIHSPHKPLSCGARVWVETRDPVEIVR